MSGGADALRDREAWAHDCDTARLYAQGERVEFYPGLICWHCGQPMKLENVTLWRVSEPRPATAAAARWEDKEASVERLARDLGKWIHGLPPEQQDRLANIVVLLHKAMGGTQR